MTVNADDRTKPRRLARFLTTVRERYWVVVLAMVVAGAAAFGASMLMQQSYSATAQVAYSVRDAQWASQALTTSGNAALVHNISNDALALRTTTFAGRVSKAMGGAVDAVEVRSSIDVDSDPQAEVISITATGPDPLRVADIADACASEFVAARQEETQALLTQAQSLVQQRLDSLSDEEKASARGTSLQQQYDNLGLLLSMQIKDYQVLQKAIVPTSPSAPRPFLNLLIGLAAGLALGIILTVLLSAFDRSIKDQTELEQLLEMPVLGTVPSASDKRARSLGVAAAVGFPDGSRAALESTSDLLSNLKALGFGETKKSLLVASTGPGEAKSVLAANLAIGMAIAGDRVILVDADLHDPLIHQCLSIANEHGLSDTLLDGASSWPANIQAVDLDPFMGPELRSTRLAGSKEPPVSKFMCLTAGSVSGDPAQVLGSGAWPALLAELEGVSDYVIISGLPILGAPDALALAHSVDAVIVASTLGKKTAAEAAQVRQLIAREELPVLGIVVSARLQGAGRRG